MQTKKKKWTTNKRKKIGLNNATNPTFSIIAKNNSTTQTYNPQVAGMVLRQAFCMLERIEKDNVETERRREILRQY